MKTRHPLANGKALPMLWFRTIGLERLPRAALGPATTRKTAQSSLKIEGLRRTHFRAPRSAATLKLAIAVALDVAESHFRAPRSAATLKRTRRWCRQTGAISALLGARPH